MDLLMEILCTALTVTYASNPYTVLLLPKGNCHLCCPYHKDDIKLYVNIPGGPEEQYLDWENGSDWRQLDNNRTTVIYIHGFTEQHTGPAATTVRKAYRERGEENLVVVDWSSLAAAPWYPSAVTNTQHVASFLAGVIDSLVIRGLPLDKIHVIGFSLGAEIAGLLAKKLTVGKLKRITGLDPALPLYSPLNPRGRLAKTDAEFVDVIHTDGGIFGFDLPLGHADFFPNGGKPAQPGCVVETLVHTGKLNEFVACSHNRAWMFYAESVRDPLAFPSFKCHTFLEFEKGKCKPTGPVAYMGYLADPRLRGKFFLDTKSTKPFGLGLHKDSISVNYHVNILEPGTGLDSGLSLTNEVAESYQEPGGSVAIGQSSNQPPPGSLSVGAPEAPPPEVYQPPVANPSPEYTQGPFYDIGLGAYQQSQYRNIPITKGLSGLLKPAVLGQKENARDKDMKLFLDYGSTGLGSGVRTLPDIVDYLYPGYLYPQAVGGYLDETYLEYPYRPESDTEYDGTDYSPGHADRSGRGVKSTVLWRKAAEKRRKRIRTYIRRRF